ncbi:MAG TPA: hypothetical protein VGP61_02860 [Gemmatimonadales bacterium]|nr:hypothetical protein [Gemmatimonadales bacterium]
MNAAFPSWIFILFGFMVFGQVMRGIFGGYRPRGRWRFEGLAGMGQEEVKRLDAAIAERDVVIEDLQRRLSEMESRLDFTERLLARPPESGAGVS